MGKMASSAVSPAPPGVPPDRPAHRAHYRTIPDTYSGRQFGEDRAARREVRRAGLCAGPSGAWPGAAELIAGMAFCSPNGYFPT